MKGQLMAHDRARRTPEHLYADAVALFVGGADARQKMSAGGIAGSSTDGEGDRPVRALRNPQQHVEFRIFISEVAHELEGARAFG